MHPDTGKLYDIVDPEVMVKRLKAAAEAQVTPHRRLATSRGAQQMGLVPVMRDLTAREDFVQQIALYAPCACGSGRKFKFCCKKLGAITDMNAELRHEIAASRDEDRRDEQAELRHARGEEA